MSQTIASSAGRSPPRYAHRHVPEFALWLGTLVTGASTSALSWPAVGHCGD